MFRAWQLDWLDSTSRIPVCCLLGQKCSSREFQPRPEQRFCYFRFTLTSLLTFQAGGSHRGTSCFGAFLSLHYSSVRFELSRAKEPRFRGETRRWQVPRFLLLSGPFWFSSFTLVSNHPRGNALCSARSYTCLLSPCRTECFSICATFRIQRGLKKLTENIMFMFCTLKLIPTLS